MSLFAVFFFISEGHTRRKKKVFVIFVIQVRKVSRRVVNLTNQELNCEVKVVGLKKEPVILHICVTNVYVQ